MKWMVGIGVVILAALSSCAVEEDDIGVLRFDITIPSSLSAGTSGLYAAAKSSESLELIWNEPYDEWDDSVYAYAAVTDVPVTPGETVTGMSLDDIVGREAEFYESVNYVVAIDVDDDGVVSQNDLVYPFDGHDLGSGSIRIKGDTTVTIEAADLSVYPY